MTRRPPPLGKPELPSRIPPGWVGLLGLVVASASPLVACGKKPPETREELPAAPSGAATVPPVALSGVAPVSDFASAAPADGKPPYDQARAYAANGQLWLARLVLEKKALGGEGTKPELELLAHVCHDQGDAACVDECGKKLGKKLKFDGGVARLPDPAPSASTRRGDSDFERARELKLRSKLSEAREILEPKVVDGRSSREETRLLREICKEEGDRMCMALCDAKLK